MKTTTAAILAELIERYKALRSVEANIEGAFDLLEETYKSGGRIFTCGNGGSASDAEHIVGELLKRFKKPRPIEERVKNALLDMGEEGVRLADTLEGSIPAIALTSHLALSTAFANDREPQATFAQQLYGLGLKGDILIAISTSGNSKNCLLACLVAKAKGIKIIAMTGAKASKLSALADVTIPVPEVETYKIQELHLPVYHALCASIEEALF